MRIFLTGATGFVGTHLCQALVAGGHQVVGYARHPGRSEAAVHWAQGEITDLNALLDGMDGCQAVIHLVGIIRETREQTYTRVHVEGTEAVVAAMRRLHLTRLLHMSALGASPKATIPYFRSKWQAEEAVRASGLDSTILRPSIIFGPGDGFVSRLADQVRRYPVLPVIGRGEYLLAPISIHALTSAFVQALVLEGVTRGKTYELCGSEILTYRQILNLVVDRLQLWKPQVLLPAGLVALAVHLARLIRLPMPITGDELRMLTANNICLDDTACSVFSLPRITLAEGITEYLHR